MTPVVALWSCLLEYQRAFRVDVCALIAVLTTVCLGDFT